MVMAANKITLNLQTQAKAYTKIELLCPLKIQRGNKNELYPNITLNGLIAQTFL